MELIRQSCQWVTPPPANTLEILELCGRVAYKSEDKITPGSAEKFLSLILTRKHESVLEHVGASMRFITDRGVSHELVRHRIASFTQESTRYVNYEKRGMQFVIPVDIDFASVQYTYWQNHMEDSEWRYNTLIAYGASPQLARSVLPNSLKTEIVMTANLREWRYVLKLRTDKTAHPQMQDLMRQALIMFREAVPILFDDI